MALQARMDKLSVERFSTALRTEDCLRLRLSQDNQVHIAPLRKVRIGIQQVILILSRVSITHAPHRFSPSVSPASGSSSRGSIFFVVIASLKKKRYAALIAFS